MTMRQLGGDDEPTRVRISPTFKQRGRGQGKGARGVHRVYRIVLEINRPYTRPVTFMKSENLIRR